MKKTVSNFDALDFASLHNFAVIFDYTTAARLPAYPIIGIPLHIGTVFAFKITAEISLSNYELSILHILGMLLMAHVLYINDYADEETDTQNNLYFNSGGSRVIADGKLTGNQLFNAAITVAVLAIGLSIYCAIYMQLYCLPAFTIFALSMGSLYSLKPFQLSYCGYGELLQGFCLGLLLPSYAYYFTTKTLITYPLWTVCILGPVFYSSNIVHALPDYPSDKASNRQTFVVLYGEFTARKVVLISYFISTFFAFYFRPQLSPLKPYLGLFLFDCMILVYVLGNDLFHNCGVLENREKCKLFVRTNMFALIGHIILWVYAYNTGYWFKL